MGKPELCPYCDGEVDRTDKECPHCHRRLTGKALLENPPHLARAGSVLPEIETVATTKRCPYCAEEIQAAAIICRHCQRDLANASAQAGAGGQTIKSADERRAILARQIERLVAPGMRVESRADFQAVLAYGNRPNHLLHFFIGLFTIGLWWIVWIFIAANNRVTRRLITVDEYGVARAKDY